MLGSRGEAGQWAPASQDFPCERGQKSQLSASLLEWHSLAQAWDLQRLRPHGQAFTSRHSAPSFSLEGHSLQVAREQQGSRLSPLPHTQRKQHLYVPTLLSPPRSTDIPEVHITGSGWVLLLTLGSVVEVGGQGRRFGLLPTHGSQILNQLYLVLVEGCSAPKGGGCLAGRSRGCRWLKGRAWRGGWLGREVSLEGWSVGWGRRGKAGRLEPQREG